MNPTPPDPNNGFDHSVGESEAEARSIQRISDELGPGTYTVQVEVEMENPDVELRVFEHVLTAEVKLTS